jgi:hypothetical protein
MMEKNPRKEEAEGLAEMKAKTRTMMTNQQ